MPHFPSTLKNAGPNNVPRRSDSLNATQQKPASHHIFSIIEEELHDARRVHSHGQEEDLRLALNMVISRVGELSSLLSEAYKTQADLEVQLNVAKSNLQLVISNNEMLEEALKRDSSGHSKDVGWRRWSARESEDRRVSEERLHSASASGEHTPTPESGTASPASTTQESRFFKFRFTGSNTNAHSSSSSNSRPGTPHDTRSPAVNGAHHLNSPSLPTLPSVHRELEELNAELQKERTARKTVADEKKALEAEIESLSQALFEEANKMVATERIKRAETEEELKEVRSEKEALQSALRLLEGENVNLRISSRDSSPTIPVGLSSHSRRTSSQLGVKSVSASPVSSPPPTPATAALPHRPPEHIPKELAEPLEPPEGEETQITPQPLRARPASLHLSDEEASPWADVPSKINSPRLPL